MNNSMHEQTAAAHPVSFTAHAHQCACNGKCGGKCACKKNSPGNGCGHKQPADARQTDGEQSGDGRP